jgi:hypothetical protein
MPRQHDLKGGVMAARTYLSFTFEPVLKLNRLMKIYYQVAPGPMSDVLRRLWTIFVGSRLPLDTCDRRWTLSILGRLIGWANCRSLASIMPDVPLSLTSDNRSP